MRELVVVGHEGAVLTVQLDGRRIELHAVWLRDACSCGACRRPRSNERLVDPASIPLDLTIEAARIESDRLLVRTSDGHELTIASDWLARHLRATDRQTSPAADRVLWDASSDGPARFAARDLEQGIERREWLDVMHERGVCIVTAEPGERGLTDVAGLIGPIRSTSYGHVWTVGATIDPATEVDSERALRVHTDLPYLDSPPGVQLMAVENDGVHGGDSTFVDGFAAAEQLRTTEPDSWRLLTTIDFAYPFVRDDIEMHGRAPLIDIGRTGDDAMIRRAPDLVGSPFVSAGETPDLYDAVRLWNRLLDGGEFEQRVTVGPGEIAMWDNHRILHGRIAFRLGSSGRRVLHGCYVDKDRLRSERALSHRPRNE